MAGADRDPLLIEDRPDVVRVDAVEDEREDADLLPRRADHVQTGTCGQPRVRVIEQVVLVSGVTFSIPISSR